MIPKLKPHVDFCRAVANGSTYKDAYLQVSCKNNTSESTAEQQGSRLAKKYDSYIQELKQKTSEAIDKAYENEAVKEALNGILTKVERMKILCEIALGEIKVKKAIITSKGIEYLPEEPDHNDRKNAIAELNKMDGSYAPIQTKTELSSKDSATETWLSKFK